MSFQDFFVESNHSEEEGEGDEEIIFEGTELISLGQEPTEKDWAYPPLHKENRNGTLSYWQIGFDSNINELIIYSGQIGGTITSHHPLIETNEDSQDIVKKFLSEARNLYRNKTREGYYVLSEDTDIIHEKIQLASIYRPLEGNNSSNIKYFPVAVQAKLDGVRAISLIDRNDVRLFSRGNKEFHHLNILKMQIRSFFDYLPVDSKLDGAGYIHDQSRQEIIEMMNVGRSEQHENEDNVNYYIFDLIIPETPYEERHSILFEAVIKFLEDGNRADNIYVMNYRLAHSHEDIKTIKNEYTRDGYEGIIIRKIVHDENGKRVLPIGKDKESFYKSGRNNNLLKYEEDIIIDTYSEEKTDEDREFIFEWIRAINSDYTIAKDVDLEILERVIYLSEVEYYNETEDPDVILDDRVYDYVKDLYRAMKAERNDVQEVDDMAHVPKLASRKVNLPIWMGSTTKINHGTGQLSIFTGNYSGPYKISAKMDGCSVLYADGKLYSRGEGDKGQNITELAQYIVGGLPRLKTGVMIRGELMIKQSTFIAKFKRNDPSETEKFRNSRNSVAGFVNKFGANAAKGVDTPLSDIQLDFVKNIELIAYEYITQEPLKASNQFEKLDLLFGNSVARHELLEEANDDKLSSLYDKYIEEMDYEIDGLIVCSDHPYERPHGSNPDYMRAYKKPLAILTGIGTVLSVEWNVSKDGMFKPVVCITPIDLDGVTIRRVTGYNAKNIRDNMIGPGAVVEVIRSGGVIPKIIKVISESIELTMPELDYYWNDTEVDIFVKFDEDDQFAPEKRDMNIKKLNHFITKMETKGIGPSKVADMYDHGIRTIVDFLSVTIDDLTFFGDKTAQNICATIEEKKSNLTLPVLCGGSMIFGRLMGVRRFEMILDVYPNLFEMDCVLQNDVDEITRLIVEVDGFALKTAQQASEGFKDMLLFLESLRDIGIVPVAKKVRAIAPQASNSMGFQKATEELAGKTILLTGFRDESISNFIISAGGKVSKSLTKGTDILVVKTSTTVNTKTKTMKERGKPILSADEFKAQYM